MIEHTDTSHVLGGAVSSSILNIGWYWLSQVSRTALAIGVPEPWRNLKHVWGWLGCVQANKDRLKGLIDTHPHWNSAAMNVWKKESARWVEQKINSVQFIRASL